MLVFQTLFYCISKKGVKTVAKDGTNRGGARPGAGRKPKALKEKMDAGNPGKRPLKIIDIPDMPDIPTMEGVDMPPPSEYLSAQQRDGTQLCADEIYIKTCTWLGSLGCEKLVSPQLVEQYSMTVARWIQCEEAVSKYGLLGKHPTVTSSAVQSPFVAMSHAYLKQATQLWFQIFGIVKENCTIDITGPNPMDDAMERLLRTREKKN